MLRYRGQKGFRMAFLRRTEHPLKTTRGTSELNESRHVFEVWLKFAVPVGVVCTLQALLFAGRESIIPMLVGISVVYITFHFTYGFVQAAAEQQRKFNQRSQK